jgi:hypothetical protein
MTDSIAYGEGVLTSPGVAIVNGNVLSPVSSRVSRSTRRRSRNVRCLGVSIHQSRISRS